MNHYGCGKIFNYLLIISLFTILSSLINVKGERKFKIYWNVPTFQCESHKINFINLTKQFNIIQNKNDNFHGEEILILYDPGVFPAILRDKPLLLRNGGIPQNGNLTLHLNKLKEIIDTNVPENFSGIGVIDFEHWRPVYRQNFGILTIYKQLSQLDVLQIHPLWPQFLIEKEAKKKFEYFARQFMEETLYYLRKLRPMGKWGYYAYPYCFNMSPNNFYKQCPIDVIKENDNILWLFDLCNNFHPSIYLNSKFSIINNIKRIDGRIEESNRLANYIRPDNKFPKIFPYFWYKYHDNIEKFITKDELITVFFFISTLNIDGLIIWGSSNDVNSKNNCLALYNYVENILGPAIIQNFL